MSGGDEAADTAAANEGPVESQAPGAVTQVTSVSAPGEPAPAPSGAAEDVGSGTPDAAGALEGKAEQPADGDPYDGDRLGDLERRVAEQRAELDRQERLVAMRRARLEANRRKVDAVRADVVVLAAARDSLATWLRERSDSLAMKLLTRMDAESSALAEDERRVRAWVDATTTVDPGEPRRLRRAFVGGLWVALILAIAVPVGLWALDRWLQSQALDYRILGGEAWRFAVVGLGLLAIVTLIALLAYHRGYAAIRQRMEAHLAEGRYLLASVASLRQERARLEGVQPQVAERMEFLGAVLHEPWRVPSYQSGHGPVSTLTDALPALLQIAYTADSDDPMVARLRAQFTATNFTPGMRRSAVESLLGKAAEHQGLGEGAMDLKVIDRDAAHYGLRSALYAAVRSPEVLEAVGREKVIDVAAQVQAGMEPSIDRPGVRIANPDALDGLRLSNDLLSGWRQDDAAWDEYVAEILEDGAALSRLAFSPQGRSEGRHLAFDSVAVAPVRLQQRAGQLVEFADRPAGPVTGTEVVARVDITPPMSIDKVALFIEPQSEAWTGQGTGEPAEPGDDEDFL